ncbi:MAG: hypothetical protein AAF733_10920 [Verrucomicrobiota bacterium]
MIPRSSFFCVFLSSFCCLQIAGASHYEWIADGEGIFRSPESVHETNSGRPCYRRIFLPEGIEEGALRGIIVWDAEPHYYPKGPRSTIQSEPWRDFAAKHGFGMAELASRPLSVEETAEEIKAIFRDMDEIFGRNDCQNAFFTFGGTSGTGLDTIELADYAPMAERMIAGFPCSMGFVRYGTFEADKGVPLLFMPAGREKFAGIRVPDVAGEVSARVSKGMPDTLLVRLGATHPELRDDDPNGSSPQSKKAIAASLELSRLWLEAMILVRLPQESSSSGEASGLRSLDTSKGWLGSFEVDPSDGDGMTIDRGEGFTAVTREGHILKNLAIAPFAELEGGLEAADTWFPNETLAKAWKTYHESGRLSE